MLQTEARVSQAWVEEEERVTSLTFPVSSLAFLEVNQFGFVVMPTDILFDNGEVLIETPVRWINPYFYQKIFTFQYLRS